MDASTRLSTCYTMPRLLKTGMWGHLGRENICNSSGSLETILHKVNVCFSSYSLPPTKHQRFSDKASEGTPMREERVVSIYSLGRLVRIHAREHSNLRSTRFSIIRHIFCMLPLGTVCLLFHKSF